MCVRVYLQDAEKRKCRLVALLSFRCLDLYRVRYNDP